MWLKHLPLQQIIPYAGSRENAMQIGHYLTTFGQPPAQDHALLKDLGLSGGEAPIPGKYSL